MDLDKIRDLLSIVAESGVSEVEVEEDEFRLVVRKNAPHIVMQQQPMQPTAMPQQPSPYFGGYAPQGVPSPPQQPQSTPAAAGAAAGAQETTPSEESAAPGEDSEVAAGVHEELIRAPIVGTFYRRPSPDDDTFVSEGDTVSKGDVLCIIEAMKIMNEIESETSGTIVEVLAEDEEPVEFDQPLFVIATK